MDEVEGGHTLPPYLCSPPHALVRSSGPVSTSLHVVKGPLAQIEERARTAERPIH